jgi:hypothetical protein
MNIYLNVFICIHIHKTPIYMYIRLYLYVHKYILKYLYKFTFMHLLIHRLFSAISSGCMPVIISDNIKLPFSNMIDYSTFTITFPESVVYTPEFLMDYLRYV